MYKMNTGWACPKCGQVYAPWVQKCEPCAPAAPVVPWYPYNPWTYPNPWVPVPFTTPYPSWTICNNGDQTS